MIKNKHSIQKVFLEIDTPSIVMANSIKNNLAVFIQNELVPILEKQFKLIETTTNQIIQIKKLEISIHSNTGKTDTFLSNSETKNDIKNQIEKEIYKTLSELKQNATEDESSKSHTISSYDKDLKTLLYFIENGSLPWYISKEDESAFFEKISFENLKNEVFKIQFRKLIQQKKIQRRIINQFSNPQIGLLTSSLFDSEIQQTTLSKNNVLQFLNNKPYEFKASFWELIFNTVDEQKPMEFIQFYYQKRTEFTSEKVSFELFIQNIKAIFPLTISDNEFREMNNNYLDYTKTKTAEKSESSTKNPKNKEEKNAVFIPEIHSEPKGSTIDDKEIFNEEKKNPKSCYIQNAGLIVLHPFLKELLKNCDLIEENKIVNKELAAHVLHYAATKNENDYEHAMIFEKFLCGIPVQQSILREIKIENKYKQHVEEMLVSVVEHWSALKNTSTDVLRSEFLQREGKLDCTESNPKVTIERKTQDLLLEKIPWNINIIKIPWMEKLIYTQW